MTKYINSNLNKEILMTINNRGKGVKSTLNYTSDKSDSGVNNSSVNVRQVPSNRYIRNEFKTPTDQFSRRPLPSLRLRYSKKKSFIQKQSILQKSKIFSPFQNSKILSNHQLTKDSSVEHTSDRILNICESSVENDISTYEATSWKDLSVKNEASKKFLYSKKPSISLRKRTQHIYIN